MVNGLKPRSLPQALELRRSTPRAVPCAGGTHLMRRGEPGRLCLYLDGCEEFTRIDTDGRQVHIGAMLTLASLQRQPLVPPVLREAAGVLPASLRSLATIGGELIAGNLPLLCALYAVGGELKLASVPGRRTMTPDCFFRNGRGLNLGAAELLCEILVPDQSMNCVFRRARGDSESEDVFFAGRFELQEGRVGAFSAVFAAENGGLMRFPDFERELIGKDPAELSALQTELLSAYEQRLFPGSTPVKRWQRQVALHMLEVFLFGTEA